MTPTLQHRTSNPASRASYNPESTHVRQIKSNLDVTSEDNKQSNGGFVTKTTQIIDKANNLGEVYPTDIVVDGAKNRTVKTAGKERVQTASGTKVHKPPLANQVGSARDVKNNEN